MGYFLAGAAVFGLGVLIGAALVRSTVDNILRGGKEGP